MSALDARTGSLGRQLVAVGIGNGFGLLAMQGNSGNGLRLGLSAAVFSQFDVQKRSNDLINADYIIGLPLTIKAHWLAIRVQVYHQSSHLGDEFLIAQSVDRINLSFEAVELLISNTFGPLRLYYGGEALLRYEPQNLAGRLVHGGVELRLPSLLPVRGLRRLRPFVAADLKSSEERAWSPAWSLRAGCALSDGLHGENYPLSITYEYYDGPTPYGQFYNDDLFYQGVGLQVDF